MLLFLSAMENVIVVDFLIGKELISLKCIFDYKLFLRKTLRISVLALFILKRRKKKEKTSKSGVIIVKKKKIMLPMNFSL